MDIIPTVDNLIDQFGTIKAETPGSGGEQTYVLLSTPKAITGPNFDHFRKSPCKPCVAAYILRVQANHTPAGNVKLAVWPDIESFHLGRPPVNSLNMLATGVN